MFKTFHTHFRACQMSMPGVLHQECHQQPPVTCMLQSQPAPAGGCLLHQTLFSCIFFPDQGCFVCPFPLRSLLGQFVLLFLRAAFSTGARTSRESACNQQNQKWQICKAERAGCVMSRTGQRRYELPRKSDCSCAGNMAFNSLENLAAGQISFQLSVSEAIPSSAKSLVKVVAFSEGLKDINSLHVCAIASTLSQRCTYSLALAMAWIPSQCLFPLRCPQGSLITSYIHKDAV